MSPDSLELVVVVDLDHPDLVERLRRRLGDDVRVVLDQRREDRRRAEAPHESERRAGERRQLLTPRAREQFRALGCRFVFEPRPDGPAAAVQYGRAFCLECERVLEFEIPQFFEPPACVEIEVQHQLSGLGVQHSIGLEALTRSGRRLVASRIRAREVT